MSEANELMGNVRLEPDLMDKVYNYLRGQKRASPPQIAQKLDMKVSTVIGILTELERNGRVERVP